MPKPERAAIVAPFRLFGANRLIPRLHLYLFRQILTAFLFSGLAVTFVVLFTQSFRLMSFVIENASGVGVFLQLMGLMIPTFLPLIVPISLGIAVLFIYHKLAVDSELVVMRAAGFSPMRLAKPALAMAGIVVVLGYVLNFWVAPAASREMVETQYRARDDFSAFMVRPGTFNDLSEGLTFFARRRRPGGGMEDILVHDIRNPEQPITIMAENGQLTVENGSPQVIVFNGRRQVLDVPSGRLQELRFDRYVLDLHVLKNNKNNRVPSPRELSMPELFQAIFEKNVAVKSESRLHGEIHQRLGGPLLSLTFAILAVTVILVGDFNRRGMTQRVLMATIGIVVVQAAMLGLVSQISREPLLFPLLYFVVLLPIPVCLRLLRRRELKAVPFLTGWKWPAKGKGA